jgi:hypothetical protein
MPVVKYTTPHGPVSIASGDFNGDDRPELAVANLYAASVSVYINDRGTFPQRFDYLVGNGPWSVVTADFDGNETLDLAVASSESNSISLLMGNGDGTFGNREDVPVGSYPIQVVAGDFNGDGKPDLASLNQGTNDISVLLNQFSATVPGDVTGNGEVNAQDATQMLRLFLGLKSPTPNEMKAGDVRPRPGLEGRAYGDNRIQGDDVGWVVRRFLGLETTP